MNKGLAIIALALTACGEAAITPASYNAAFDLCKPHGGLVWVTRVESYLEYDKIKIVCNDNDVVAFMRIDKPKPPQAAASGASQ